MMVDPIYYDATTTDDGTAPTDDAALAAIPPDTLDQPQDDPQHHGV